MRAGDALEVETDMTSCFSTETLRLRLAADGTGVQLTCHMAFGGTTGKEFGPVSVDVQVADTFIGGLLAVLQKKHMPAPGRTTTRTRCVVRWDIGGDAGIQECESTGLETEELCAIASNAQLSPEARTRAQATLDRGVHDWTHEVSRLANALMLAVWPDARPQEGS